MTDPRKQWLAQTAKAHASAREQVLLLQRVALLLLLLVLVTAFGWADAEARCDHLEDKLELLLREHEEEFARPPAGK